MSLKYEPSSEPQILMRRHEMSIMLWTRMDVPVHTSILKRCVFIVRRSSEPVRVYRVQILKRCVFKRCEFIVRRS